MWRCRCDCGGEKIVDAVSLRSGHTKSCGCYKLERFSGVITGWRTVDYSGAHARVNRVKGPAAAHQCVDCGAPAQEWSYDGLDPDAQRGGRKKCLFSSNPEHYVARCCPCHQAFDKAS